MKLNDKVVVVTGSGNGIGEAFARRFVHEGAKVVVTDIEADADFARRAYGEIDLWFSNAGYSGPPERGDLQTDDVWDLTWHLHVMAHVYAARAVLPSMVARGEGYLLQTASSVALSAQPDTGSYSVTKHAALALAEWLAITYRPKGV